MDIEELKRRLHALEVSVQKSLVPVENIENGVSAVEAKFLWADYNKLLKDFKGHSDLFGEYREVQTPAPVELVSRFTAPVTGYTFDSLKPLSRQIQALKQVIEQHYL